MRYNCWELHGLFSSVILQFIELWLVLFVFELSDFLYYYWIVSASISFLLWLCTFGTGAEHMFMCDAFLLWCYTFYSIAIGEGIFAVFSIYFAVSRHILFSIKFFLVNYHNFSTQINPIQRQETVSNCNYYILPYFTCKWYCADIYKWYRTHIRARVRHNQVTPPSRISLSYTRKKCPLCRKYNTFYFERDYILRGLETDTKCCACLETTVCILFPDCYHVPLCIECFNKL